MPEQSNITQSKTIIHTNPEEYDREVEQLLVDGWFEVGDLKVLPNPTAPESSELNLNPDLLFIREFRKYPDQDGGTNEE